MKLSTPVVLVIYRRAALTARVVAAIAHAEPPVLYVVADGPRSSRVGEAEAVAAARAEVGRIDWGCRVLRDYADHNMGLTRRMVTGLDWVFGLEERAIVLEDDCLPDPSFFRYCDELLQLYQEDERVMVVSGDNYQRGRQRAPYSYYFSRYNHCWGWATWRRAWRYYDQAMRLWPEMRNGHWLVDMLDRERTAARYWRDVFEDVYCGRVDTWDYQWTFACWAQSGLTTLPMVNLVANIGFGRGATHRQRRTAAAAPSAHALSFPLCHPPFVIRDAQADRFTQRTHYGGLLRRRLAKTARRMAAVLGMRF